MITYRDLAVKALEQMRGYDLVRLHSRFAGFTPEQMQMPFGDSGRTGSEILACYLARNAEIDAAIAWVKAHAE